MGNSGMPLAAEFVVAVIAYYGLDALCADSSACAVNTPLT